MYIYCSVVVVAIPSYEPVTNGLSVVSNVSPRSRVLILDCSEGLCVAAKLELALCMRVGVPGVPGGGGGL